MKKYRVKYKIDHEIGQFTKDELRKDGSGGCDAFVFASILRCNETGEPHEGAKSIGFLSVDGRTDHSNIPDTEMFQVFGHLAKMVSELPGCLDWQRELASLTHEMIKKVILTEREP